MKYKRIFLIVMDSLGVGNDKDAYLYGDNGTNTFKHIVESVENIKIPTLTKLGINDLIQSNKLDYVNHDNSFTCALNESSIGKDTMTGHWEMMGIKTTKPFKTFTDHGFPKELIVKLENQIGSKLIGNKAASGTEIIKELGLQQIKENSLIIYTSSDSVLQLAAHESHYGLDNLYKACEIAREICMEDKYKVARIIARPYIGDNPNNFKRTPNRHDYAIKPPYDTVLNILQNNSLETISIGKINDIFDGSGINKAIKTISNNDGIDKTIEIIKNEDFKGLCFVNLVEFDSEYGHRRNIKGYAQAIEEFDLKLSSLLKELKDDDLLMITADHGNDPTHTGTDHTREQVPLIIYNKNIKNGRKLNNRDSFADIGMSILKNYNLESNKNLIGHPIEEI
jgi:phosphopentomutase